MFGWLVAGQTKSSCVDQNIATHHSMLAAGDELLQRFWEVEENPRNHPTLSPEEKSVVQQLMDNHYRSEDRRFVALFPKKSHGKPIGESRFQAVMRSSH